MLNHLVVLLGLSALGDFALDVELPVRLVTASLVMISCLVLLALRPLPLCIQIVPSFRFFWSDGTPLTFGGGTPHDPSRTHARTRTRIHVLGMSFSVQLQHQQDCSAAVLELPLWNGMLQGSNVG